MQSPTEEITQQQAQLTESEGKARQTQRGKLTSRKRPGRARLCASGGLVRSENPSSFQEGEAALNKTEESRTVSSILVTQKTCCVVQICFEEENEQKTRPG